MSRATWDSFGSHRNVVLDVGVARPWPEILGGSAAGGCYVHQDRLGMVLHFGITEAAHDGQQVGAVDVGDTELVPENLGFWVVPAMAVIVRERATRKQQRGDRGQPAN